MRPLIRAVFLAVVATAALPVVRIPVDLLAAQDTLPVGFGSLRRDDIAVQLATDQVAIQLLPLRESVIRLLAPDTYASLRSLLAKHQTALDSIARQAGERHPLPVLVTFFGLVPNGHFVPEDLDLASSGQLYRPIGIVPLSPQWSSNQVDPRAQVIAIYLYDEDITLGQDLTVSYGSLSSDSWSHAVRLLDQERARVLSRAASSPK
ncbi:MAG TPA: hypothetical protein VLV45_11635 [Gemmatimonadales bacterium]|nr:hypothetical protein [Gemmatimonadales bacterium]